MQPNPALVPEDSPAPAFLSLFSGIGGLDIGLERSGFRCVGQVEVDPFCRRVLAKHWPDVPRFEDVRTFTKDNISERIDLIAGGFPCQDISRAGKQTGIYGKRSGLWSEFFRLIRDIRPAYVLVENVAALIDGGLDRVLGDLATIRFVAEWSVLPLCALGAPHARERLFLVAYPHGQRRPEMALPDHASHGAEAFDGWASIHAGPLVGACSWQDWEKQSGVQLVADGIPGGVGYGRAACQASGNSVSPQVAEWIGRRIRAAMEGGAA